MNTATIGTAGGTRRVSGVVVPNRASGKQRALALAAANLMRLLGGTLRYRVNGVRGPAVLPDQPVIFALWHMHLGMCMKAYRSFVRPDNPHEHLAALISASKDGAFLEAILREFGVEAVRGSTSRRGAQALLELTSWARRGFDLAVTPDGPRGPRCVVQEGVISLAQVTGLPIVPYSCRLSWRIRLRSWDRFEVPLPFSRCDMTFGTPITVSREATPEARSQLREELQRVLRKGVGTDAD